MPLWSGHPPFQVLTYRSPLGIRSQGDQGWLAPDRNAVNLGLISEMIIGTSHSGTHIDALAHVTTGAEDRWHGGVRSLDSLGDFGPLRDDASALPTLLCRGVMLDVAKALGYDRLPKSFPIGADHLRETAAAHDVELARGDVVLVRTGQMSVWPDAGAMAETAGAGIDRDAAEYLVAGGARAVGADTESCEVVPSTVPGHPHPVHDLLLVQSGVYIIENILLEELSRRDIHQFLFVALPLKITGATASMLRPVAVI